MAKIINRERGTITLPTGHVVPRLGTLDTDNATIRQVDNWCALSGRAAAGQVTIEFDPEPDPDEPGATITPAAPLPPEPNAVLILTGDAPAADAKPATKAAKA